MSTRRKEWRSQRNSKVRRRRLRRLFEKYNGRCALCNHPVELEGAQSPDKATVDHVIPLCAGGEDNWDNWQLACNECNNKKGGEIAS